VKKENFTKIVGILTIITTIITVIVVAFNFLVHRYILYKLHANISEVTSIGVIGGADGPTAIYVTNQSSANMIIVTFSLLSITGIAYQIFAKKQQNKLI
jgi:Na+-transporting methylmalonyl-CoA/oxaloacetate decarboxylase beta subunit